VRTEDHGCRVEQLLVPQVIQQEPYTVIGPGDLGLVKTLHVRQVCLGIGLGRAIAGPDDLIARLVPGVRLGIARLVRIERVDPEEELAPGFIEPAERAAKRALRRARALLPVPADVPAISLQAIDAA